MFLRHVVSISHGILPAVILDIYFNGSLSNFFFFSYCVARFDKLNMDIDEDWVNPSKKGEIDGVFSRAGRAFPRDFPRAKPKGNTKEQPCQPEENLVHPDSFTWIYILFKIGYFGDISDFFKY